MIYLFGGGTVSHVCGHFALCAPAYGGTVRQLYKLLEEVKPHRTQMMLTRMAGGCRETPEEVEQALRACLADPATVAVVFNVAMVDFSGTLPGQTAHKYASRPSSRDGDLVMHLTPQPKVLPLIKALRPDVHVTGFKTTVGVAPAEQALLAQRQMQEAGVDVVFANDTVTRRNALYFADGRERVGSRDALLQHLATCLGAL